MSDSTASKIVFASHSISSFLIKMSAVTLVTEAVTPLAISTGTTELDAIEAIAPDAIVAVPTRPAFLIDAQPVRRIRHRLGENLPKPIANQRKNHDHDNFLNWD
tara:strand:- start:161 stop:472 length:312 start_codon:yes stop_codon:yes gene_type:complete